MLRLDPADPGFPRPRTAAAVAALVALILFLPTLGHEFAYDDGITVLENPLVREGRFLDALVSPYHAGPSQKIPTGLYRPLTTGSFAANHLVHALEPAGYHAVNILLHAAVTALVSLLTSAVVDVLGSRGRQAGLAGLLAGLVFAVHPVHVEAVANISGRAELLSALFGSGALLAFARLRDAQGRPSPGAGPLAGALLLAACLAKESSVMLLIPAVLWELFRTRRPREAWRAAGYFVPAVGAYLALRVAVLGALTPTAEAVTFLENPVVGQPPLVRLATVLAVAARAAGLLFLPWTLTPDYGYAHTEPVRALWDPALLAGIATLAAAGFALARWWRDRPDAAFGVVLLLAPWLLVSNLFVTIGTIFGERFLYLPSAGFALVLGGAAASALAASRAPRGWVGAIVLLLLLAAARTSAYAPAWHDDFRLFSAAERAAPRSVRVLSNLGTELALRGELTEAEARLARAREIAPWVLPVRINLAGVYLNMGRLDEAEAEARAALRIAPDDPVARAQWEVIRSKR